MLYKILASEFGKRDQIWDVTFYEAEIRIWDVTQFEAEIRNKEYEIRKNE